MGTTPKDVVQNLLGTPGSAERRLTAQLEKAFNDGKVEGRSEARRELLGWLEKKYMDPAVQRGSTVGQAILEITREMGEYFRRAH